MSECWSVKKQNTNPTSNVIVQVVHKLFLPQSALQHSEFCKDNYQSFVSDRQVLKREDSEAVSIKVLQHTGAA